MVPFTVPRNPMLQDSRRAMMANQLIAQGGVAPTPASMPVNYAATTPSAPTGPSPAEAIFGALPFVGSLVSGISGIVQAEKRRKEMERQRLAQGQMLLAQVLDQGQIAGFRRS